MQRILRPLLFVIAVFLLVLAGRAAGMDHTPSSRTDLQTAAPSGRIVLLYTASATAADQARVAALAGLPVEPRLPAALLAELVAGERNGSPALARLARYAHLDAPHLDRDALLELVRRLAADRAVETAYLEPRPVPAALGFDAFTGASPGPITTDPAITLSSTPDFTELQGYLRDAPVGIGSSTMADVPGARGGTVRIIDVEGAWLWAHEDLPDPFVDLGNHINDLGWRNHGTAVVAQMRGSDNGYGVIGIVPDCEVGNSSIGGQSVVVALLHAAQHLGAGDLILIELHAPGPNSYEGGGQFGYLPMEFWPDNFDAIRAITDLGIIVVEAAGNGQQDLDDPLYQGLFDREVRDSGAIMVGATAGSDLHPAWFTNHGSRVDLSGWGASVVTSGYGDLQGGPETEWYTAGFSGTSSASPIVTGAVASLQGMVAAAFAVDLDAGLATQILRQTGTATSGPELIGPRPDLVAAWELAGTGVGQLAGTVTEIGSGLPLAGVTLRVLPTGPSRSTDDDGQYRMALLPGAHEIEVSSYFHGLRIETVEVAVGQNQHDIQLELAPLVTFTGQVRGADLMPLGSVELQLVDDPVPAVWSNPDGTFTLPPVPAGRPRLLLAGGAPWHGGLAWNLPADPTSFDLVLTLPAVTHDFESGPDGFTATGSLWQHGNPTPAGVGPGRAFDGDLCWGIGLEGDGYPDNAQDELWSPLYTSADFAGRELYLSFHFWCGTETGYDGVNVVLDPDGDATVIHPLQGYTDPLLGGLGSQPGWSGVSDGWRTAIFDLTEQLGVESWRFALRFGSDEWVTADGFLVDGITLHAKDTTVHVDGLGPTAAASPRLSAWPNPFNPQVQLSWSLPTSGRLDLDIFDLRGRLVRRLLQDATVGAQGSVVWDGADHQGRALASGVYLVRMQTGSGAATTSRITLAR